ncbi:beta-ketoacyl-[acyl-carrier-protein] synthase family protein [Desulfatiglans anilini]|uniref:beta-ketoacyl-[acyl-carrier-protein] synthase family protein n=1 Tax=Desulfatiglans anilini TaxID=90728 RepID=UPI0009FE7447|nr:beta-ketoacyl-[acyl-carrier-protein] synthase family protein [Desulfatiglans anilini]
MLSSSPSARPPVAVTGIGMICPLGVTVDECWKNMLNGQSGIRPITEFETSGCSTTIGGQLPEAASQIEKKRTPKRLFKQTIRSSRLIRLCAQDAMTDCSVELRGLDATRCAIIVGTSGSSVGNPLDLTDAETERFRIIRDMVNAPAAWLSIEFGFKGPAFTLSAAAASGIYAAAAGVDLIRHGWADLVVVGGVDTVLTKNSLIKANHLKMLSTRNAEPEKALRPFDIQRDGCLLSDGACAVVLESLPHARSRNAPIYAWIQGYATCSEPYSPHSEARDGAEMARTMEMGLQDSGMPKESIGYLSAAATSAVISDALESQAIRTVFGGHAEALGISAIQSMIGHTMGASGLIALSTTALALKTQMAPPTINYAFPDPACDLDYIPNSMRKLNGVEGAMVNAFSIGGHNAVAVLSRQGSLAE